MKLTVGTTPVPLDPTGAPDSRETGLVLIVQNLGPDPVYFDFDSGVTAGTGVKIAAGGGYEFPRASARVVHLVSDGDADVRWAAVD